MCGNVVSLIALVPMLIHSIFGCCWHHGHSHSGHEHFAAALINSDASLGHGHAGPSNCSGHGSPSPGGERHSDDIPPEPPCDDDRCVHSEIVATVPGQLVSLEFSGLTYHIPADQQVRLKLRTAVWGELRDWSFSHSARERRALTQVWLI